MTDGVGTDMNHFAPSNRHEVLLRLKFFNLIKE